MPGETETLITSCSFPRKSTITDYESDDPNCQPQVYTQGMGFVDSGGDHVHMIRNEGNLDATTTAVQLIPAGAARRIDERQPSNCHI